MNITPEQLDKLRIGIAESLGWEWHILYSWTISLSGDNGDGYKRTGLRALYPPDAPMSIFHSYAGLDEIENSSIDPDTVNSLPKYHESLDACAEFEKKITGPEWVDYEMELIKLYCDEGIRLQRFLVCASPIARCIAYANMKGINYL